MKGYISSTGKEKETKNMTKLYTEPLTSTNTIKNKSLIKTLNTNQHDDFDLI